MSEKIKLQLPTDEEVAEFHRQLLEPSSNNEQSITNSPTKRTMGSSGNCSKNDSASTASGAELFVIDTGSQALPDGNQQLFAIDRRKDDQDSLETDNTDGSPNPAWGGFSSAKELIEWARTIPTSLQVEDIPTIFDEGLTISKPAAKKAEPEIMKKSVMQPGFEKQFAIPAYSEGKKTLAKRRREEKASTKGSDWFDMKAPEMTEELEADVDALQMRRAMGSWTGYKKSDYKKRPKFFQVATVEDSAVDFYESRVPKKDRKQTLVDELLADAEFRKNNKKMYGKAVEKLGKKIVKKKPKRAK